MSIWMRSALVALTLLPMSCKKDNDSKDDPQTYIALDADSIVYKSPLGSIQSKDNFLLHFSVEDGGSLTFIAHSDSGLNHGISVILTRSGTQLSAQLGTVTTVLSGVDASAPITVSIDVHNNETPAHVVIYGEDGGEPLFNSEDAGADAGNGSGTAWGLVLNKAQVSSVEVRDPQFEE